ncbi:hypothetical protein [Saccharolobus caldissimus]|uniref:Uncharacterized protein n=1 Tax=Saccharolobus caldissimus TaxID=1702097 RepID=A0AAQ4CWL0_9CREN|nr:hypothetical protein [Saccharolobus caldissimus]BDC00192.1 hypothetical protein SACC_32080 [Saccharolobus caldissimus]
MEEVVEGYFLKFKNSIWAVKGCYHPDGYAVAIPRLVNGVKIKTLSLALDLAREKFGELFKYVKEIGFEVPLIPLNESEILSPFRVEIFDPIIVKFRNFFNNEIGVTGSYLYSGKGEDIDFLSFKSQHYLILRKLRLKGVTKPLIEVKESEVETLDYHDFKLLKSRRILEGLFENKEYTFKIVECENFGEVKEIRDFKGYVKIKKLIKPFSLPVKYLAVDESGNDYILTSFRIRFTEIPLDTILYINGKVLLRNNFKDIDLDIAKTVKLKIPK